MPDSKWRDQWSLRQDVTFLNHGSFGPSPHAVRAAQRKWMDELEADPMDFFVHRLEGYLAEARKRLGAFVGTEADNLLLVDNATEAMNVVAGGFELQPGDEILATDHEYGAVERIWNTVAARSGAKLVIRPLPEYLDDPAEVVRALFAGATPRTRLILFSHISSATAVILPAAEICREARSRGLAVCIDGPHAIGMEPVDLTSLDCDFYCASCHKWLSAPFGSGFLYVHARQRAKIRPLRISWGETPGGRPSWHGEFDWTGTRDPAANLSVATAIAWLQDDVGLNLFRTVTHNLAQIARQELLRVGKQKPLTPDDRRWYGSMAAVPIPPGDAEGLQERLWRDYKIEVLVKAWRGKRLLRVSCHLYNSTEDVERLMRALSAVLADGG